MVLIIGLWTEDVDELEMDAVSGVQPPFNAADETVDGVGGVLAEHSVVVLFFSDFQGGMAGAEVNAQECA